MTLKRMKQIRTYQTGVPWTTRRAGYALLCAAALALSACSTNGPAPTPTDTQAPTVSLTASPSSLSAAGNVSLSASASDNVGVVKVEFYEGGTLLGEDTSAPYTFSDPVSTSGTRNYTAKAYDAAGNAGASGIQTVTATITTGPGNGVWDSSNWDNALFQ